MRTYLLRMWPGAGSFIYLRNTLLMAWRCMYSTGQTQPFELKATDVDVCLHVKVRLSVLVQAYAHAFINLNIFKASPNFSEWERPSVR